METPASGRIPRDSEVSYTQVHLVNGEVLRGNFRFDRLAGELAYGSPTMLVRDLDTGRVIPLGAVLYLDEEGV